MLIDHGRAFHANLDKDGDEPAVRPSDWVDRQTVQLRGYLHSLTLPENASHAGNARALLERFANMTDDQLIEMPKQGIPADAMDPADTAATEQWLRVAREEIRQFLAANPA